MAAGHVHRARPGPGAPHQPAGPGLALSRPHDEDQLAARKRDHLRLALSGDVGSTITTGLERWRVRAVALPERDLADVDLTTEVLGRRLTAPLLISCMTGGASEAGPVNRSLAAAAQAAGVALGLGSGRALLEGGDDSSFSVRDVAPDVLLLANLGAVSLHDHGVAGAAEVVRRCEADALVLHLNAVQEAVQPEGDTRFGGLLRLLSEVCAALDVPVIVKEVGFGLSGRDVEGLVAAGVAGVDVAGAGGTNWATIEGLRDDHAGRVAAAFSGWGWPTASSLVAARAALDAAGARVVLIGSGGLADGVDALKALALGADLAGMARGLLAAAADGPAAATAAVSVWVDQLHIAAWAAGAGSLDDIGPHLLQPA